MENHSVNLKLFYLIILFYLMEITELTFPVLCIKTILYYKLFYVLKLFYIINHFIL